MTKLSTDSTKKTWSTGKSSKYSIANGKKAGRNAPLNGMTSYILKNDLLLLTV